MKGLIGLETWKFSDKGNGGSARALKTKRQSYSVRPLRTLRGKRICCNVDAHLEDGAREWHLRPPLKKRPLSWVENLDREGKERTHDSLCF